MSKSITHGGPRKGAGRKPGKKAFVNVKPNPTKVRRIPVPLLEAVDEMISLYKDQKKSLS